MADKQVLFLEKNRADLQNGNVSITASQGQDFVDFVRNRKNSSSWATTGSVDADNTTMTIDLTDEQDISKILLFKMNFDSYTLKYWNGSSFVDFSPAISVSGNTVENAEHDFTEVSTSQVQLIVTGTIVPDSDKTLAQFILTKTLGRMVGWPEIKNPKLSRNRKVNKMLSGKVSVVENVRQYSTSLSIKVWSDDADWTLVETLYERFTGFLFWPSGGDETQFSSVRQGYRTEDIFLCKLTDELNPEFFKGLYKSGLKLSMKLSESVD